MMRNKEDNDLRDEIYHLKKQLSSVSAENALLKVKVRKLTNEINRKDKQMDALFDTRIKSPYYEMSASFIMNMKEKNERLVKIINDKDMTIKKLISQLEVKRLYSSASRPLKKVNLQVPCYISSPGASKKWADLEEETSTLIEELEIDADGGKKHDVKEQYRGLPKEHLLSIIESLKTNQPRFSPRSSRKSSPESDLERIELCESPHEEIKQLHLYFLEMLSEVDDLKNTIVRLENNQEKTDNVLKKKKNNIDQLAKEIKSLKNPTKNKETRCKSASSNDLLRIYSGNSGKRYKTKEKRTNLKNQNVLKDAFVQAEEDPIVYVNKSGIFISNRNCQTSKEEYDDDFEKEECNNEAKITTD